MIVIVKFAMEGRSVQVTIDNDGFNTYLSDSMRQVKCYKTLSEALAITDIKFYDTTNKKVWKNYPSNLFIYKDRDNNNQFIS